MAIRIASLSGREETFWFSAELDIGDRTRQRFTTQENLN